MSFGAATAAAGSCCRPVIWTNWLALMLAHPLHYINPSRILQLDSRLGCWKVTPRWRSGHRARRRRRHHHSRIFLLLLILLLQQQQRLQLKHETSRKPSSAGAVCSAGNNGNRNRRARSAGEPSGQYGSYGQYIVIRAHLFYTATTEALFFSLSLCTPILIYDDLI